jgi:TonB family protein
MGRMWEWCLKYLPEDRSSRYLVVTVIVSVLFHILIGVGLIVGGDIEQRKIAAKRGEALLVDMAPDKPKETAPLGDPSRLPVPNTPDPPRQAAPPTPPAPKAAPVPAAPRVAEAPKAAPKAPPAAPRSADPGPVPKAAPPAPAPDQSQSAQAAPQAPAAQPQPPAPSADPRVASAPPQPPPAAAMFRRGGGGGLKGGRGGIEGEEIPLDTPDPNYREYMQKVKRKIYENWGYPYEAQIRGLHGQLVMRFDIAKDGHLEYIELRSSSGQEILDIFALNAVKLGQRYPPLPDAMRRDVLIVTVTFVYVLHESRSIQQLLQ